MPAFTDDERAILDWLAGQEARMVALLEEVVNIDSGSYAKEGIDRVGAAFRRHLAAAGIETRTVCFPANGDNVIAQIPGRAPGAHALLLGHMDTVFQPGTAAARPFRIDGRRAYGPGVADMKAGLVMNTFVAEAFARVGGAPMPLTILYTGDEEIASPASREVIRACAKGAALVLNAEPGRPTGNVVTGRKGALFFKLEVSGRSAHAGVEPGKGASAIAALARKVLNLQALNDDAVGNTVNVGLISGGESVNTVAPSATAEVDVRFRTAAAMADLKARIAEIVATVEIPGTSARMTNVRDFLPFVDSPANQALFCAYVAAAADVGLSVSGEFTGGSADSGFTAEMGAPTLCATGPVGGRAHSPEEFCELDTLVPRAQAAALTLLRAGG